MAVPPCVFCIEDHHTARRNHDPQLTAPVCELHHRELHEELLRAGVSLRFEPDPIKRVATALRAEAVYDRKRADARERWADLLEGWKGEHLMNGTAKHPRTAIRREPSGFDLLVMSMFKMALPVWERYEGRVPARELRKLERAGDWPRGLAVVIIKRLNEDDELRRGIPKLVLKRPEETGLSVNEPTA